MTGCGWVFLKESLLKNKTKDALKLQIPDIAGFILKALIPAHDFEYTIGVYEQSYMDIKKQKGKLSANLWLFFQLCLAVPAFLKMKCNGGMTMIKNYIKIAFRTMRRHKIYSFINIAGLTVGISCFILLILYVQYERSFDAFHKKADRIYRIIRKHPGRKYRDRDFTAQTPGPLAQTLAEEYPEVDQATKLGLYFQELLFTHGNQSFYENGISADKNFFKVFSFTLLRGNPETALAEPASIVLTEKLAEKYFGNEEPLGKTMRINDEYDAKVTGIIEKIPKNSHLQFDYIMSLMSLKLIQGDNNYLVRWDTPNNFQTYITLHKDTDFRELEKKLPGFVQRYLGDLERNQKGQMESYFLQSLKSIHLDSRVEDAISVNSNKTNIYVFTIIASFILLIACINYVNLTTARASKRSKEIGIRKVVGAFRQQLLKQFLFESIILTILAFSAASLIVLFILPVFNSFIDREITIHFLKDPSVILCLISLLGLTAILSGLYPSVAISSFQPIKILKGADYSVSRKSRLRNSLVVFQFCISILLLLGTLVIIKQLNFIRNKEMGFNRENILVVTIRDNRISESFPSIKNAFLQYSNITAVTKSNDLPITRGSTGGVIVEGTNADPGYEFKPYIMYVDHDFLNVFAIDLVAGRNFSTEFINESLNSVIINETAARMLGWKDPIGKECRTWPAEENGKVIGVVKDFHFHSLYSQIAPLIVTCVPQMGHYLSFKLGSGDVEKTIAFIKKTLKSFGSNRPLEYFFFDDTFDRMYRSEQKLGAAFNYLSALALFIACLGLFGLASYTAETRTKEIGIRKVLGAPTSKIIFLLSGKFASSILFANIIALPFAYYVSLKWLENFAYKTSIPIWIFLLPAAISFIISLLTVSFQTIKAATANPVDSLRYE
jgi:putative ABC transport system permease protein